MIDYQAIFRYSKKCQENLLLDFLFLRVLASDNTNNVYMTFLSQYCGKTGFYNVEVGIDASGEAYFRDNICGEMKIKLENATGPWYLFIGA